MSKKNRCAQAKNGTKEGTEMKRRKLLTGTATLAVTAALAGLFFMHGETGTLQEQAAAEASIESEFKMREGASVRLNKENDRYGIRFGATVADETQNYTMMIVPTELTAGYDKATDGTLSEYCERRAAAAHGRVAKAENLVADKNKEITCALVNVRWENLNRAFTAIAYYESDGTRIEAERAGENERSVFEVAKRALESGTLDESEREAVLKLKTDGEKEADGVAVDVGLTDELFEAVKETEVDAVDCIADTWRFCGKNRLRVKTDAKVLSGRLRYATGTAGFTLKSMWRTATAELKNADGEILSSVQLNAGEEAEVRLATEILETCSEIVFACEDEMSGSDSALYVMSEIREKSAADAAAEMNLRIDDLLSMYENLGGSDGNGGEYGQYVAELSKAKRAYDSGLSSVAKEAVEKSGTLAWLWSKVFDNRTELISAADNSGFVGRGLQANYGATMQTKKYKDEIFGDVWEATRATDTSAAGEKLSHTPSDYLYKTEIRYGVFDLIESNESLLTEAEKTAAIQSEKERLSAGFSTVKFYVYADHTAAKGEEFVMFLTTPSQKYYETKTNEEQDRKEIKLTNGAWTEISLTRAEFLKYGRMTVKFALLADGDSDGFGNTVSEKSGKTKNTVKLGCLRISAFFGLI